MVWFAKPCHTVLGERLDAVSPVGTFSDQTLSVLNLETLLNLDGFIYSPRMLPPGFRQ